MAEKVAGKPKKGRKAVREAPGKGHNTEALGADYEEIAKAYLEKKEAMESDMAGYRSEINDIYTKGAEKLGVKKTVLSTELKRLERKKKDEAKEQEMAPDEREQTELLRTALTAQMGDLGRWAVGKLAKPNARKSAEE